MKQDFTNAHSFFQMRPADEGTSASRRAHAVRVITDRLTIDDLESAISGELERAFDKAAANGREHEWEKFVARAGALAPNLNDSDLGWLQRALITQHSSLRATAALTRALGVIAEARPDYVAECATAFERLARHRSPEIRSIVLEWALELGSEAAQRIASSLAEDPHTAVRQAAQAVLAAR